jgi:hypothetical protein
MGALCAERFQSILPALDRLYMFHNAILVESRFIKALFFYCYITFVIYMLTSNLGAIVDMSILTK